MRSFQEKGSVAYAILHEKLVAILRNVDKGELRDILQACYEGGIRVAEIALNSPEALHLLDLATQQYGAKMIFGAGTVTSPKAAKLAIQAGARFVITPVVLPDVIQTCKDEDITVIAGAFSPTEIHQAYSLGADVVKVFPAASLGASYFREIRGPMPEIPLAAVGGVTLENGAAFLRAGAKVLGVGSALTPKDILYRKDWEGLKELARRFKELTISC